MVCNCTTLWLLWNTLDLQGTFRLMKFYYRIPIYQTKYRLQEDKLNEETKFAVRSKSYPYLLLKIWSLVNPDTVSVFSQRLRNNDETTDSRRRINHRCAYFRPNVSIFMNSMLA